MERRVAKELLPIDSWLSRAGEGVEWALAIANRNFIIHQYDQIDRKLTWLTLSADLPEWHSSLRRMIAEARSTIEGEGEGE